MKIVVIGGSGLIGSKLVPKLPEPRHDTLSASPSPDVDTLTGEGLPEALDGAAMVVDVSNSSSFDDEAVLRFFFDTSTRNLLAAEAVAGVSHQFRLDDIVRRRLEENHHPRDVIVDPWAPYFGAKLSERTVVPDYTGFAISDALAADHPDRVDRVALLEIPGSPGTVTAPPLFLPGPLNDRLWASRLQPDRRANGQLVAGREDIFFRWEFDAPAKKLPNVVTTTTSASSPTPTTCAAASGGTGRSIQPSHRTSSETRAG